jgi:amino acid transporter
METKKAVGWVGLVSIVLSWVGYLLLAALFFYGIYEAFYYYGLISGMITAVPLIGQIYWFLIRREDFGLYTWFTYAYTISLGSIVLSWVFMWLQYRPVRET